MLFKSSTVVALLASALQALALPQLAERASTGSVNVVNRTPDAINYALVGEGHTISTGSIPAGATKNLPMSPDDKGYSVKLGPNPESSEHILQFEYTYSSDRGNKVYFDWSCVNCHPDPFHQYARTITPSRPTAACKPIHCKPGQDDAGCEFTSSKPGPVHACHVFDGVVLTATIG